MPGRARIDQGLAPMRVLLIGIASLAAATSAGAQTVQIKVSPGPYYQGETIEVHVVTDGFEEEPTPRIEFDKPRIGRLEFLGMSPSVRSSISIVNGRMTRTKQVNFTYRYRYSSTTPRNVMIGPFKVVQGSTRVSSEPLRIQIRPLGKSKRVKIEATWTDAPVYPGQRMEVEIEWIFDPDLHDRMRSYRIEIPIFNRNDLFRYVDDPPKPGETELSVQTSRGEIALRASVTERIESGQRVKVVKAKRTLIPLQPGEFDFAAPTVVIDEVTRWRRDLFGQRTPQGTRKVPAIGSPARLVVRDVPAEGRPPSYAGAIGRGFSLEMKADRSVLQVGDPIELELELRGDGNLESAGMPDLTGPGGLDPQLFRVPSGELAGILEDGTKSFRIQARVLDASVREIPPLAYSYFDTDKGEYITVHTQPIALSVRRGRIVTADDVVSPVQQEDGADSLRSSQEQRAGRDAVPLGDSRSASGRLVLSGANLSIVREPAKLTRAGSAGGSRAGLIASLHVLPLLAIAGAIWMRRRADLDPAVVSRRSLHRRERERIAAAAGAPRAEAMATLADALRTMLKAAPEARPAKLDNFLAECDAVAYAPPGAADGALEPAAHEMAMELARAIEEGAER